jgi:hypothetical protein
MIMQKILIYISLICNLTFICSCKVERKYKESFELAECDFQEYPIWENCIFNGLTKMHYKSNITESTFTPYLDKELIKLEFGFFYVKAKFRFADLSEYNGYLIPVKDNFDSTLIRKMEPTIFYHGRKLTFWKGIISVDSLVLKEFYENTHKTKAEIFPITFIVDTTLLGRKYEGKIPGIGYCIDNNCDSIRFNQ